MCSPGCPAWRESYIQKHNEVSNLRRKNLKKKIVKLAGNIVFTIYVETSTWNWFLTNIGSYKIRKLVSVYYLQFQAFANMQCLDFFTFINH